MKLDAIPSDWANWFAGLCDGEASLTHSTYFNRSHVSPRISICMQRDDDMLRDVQRVLGVGTFCATPIRNKRKEGTVFKPRGIWCAASAADCRAMCRFFERYPLRSKKRAEFEVWQRLVRAYSAGSRSFSQLLTIALDLSRLRDTSQNSNFIKKAEGYLTRFPATSSKVTALLESISGQRAPTIEELEEELKELKPRLTILPNDGNA